MSNAEGGGAQFFRHPLGDFFHPLKITLPPPGRNPENAPVCYVRQTPKSNFNPRFSKSNRKTGVL